MLYRDVLFQAVTEQPRETISEGVVPNPDIILEKGRAAIFKLDSCNRLIQRKNRPEHLPVVAKVLTAQVCNVCLLLYPGSPSG